MEHAIKTIEKELERKIRELVNIDVMLFRFTPGRGTTDTLLAVRRMQEEYKDKERKLCMYFVDIEKAFDRVQKKMTQCSMRKKRLPEVIVGVVMSLYHRANTKVRVGLELFEEFLVQVGVHQVSALSPLLSATTVDEMTEYA